MDIRIEKGVTLKRVLFKSVGISGWVAEIVEMSFGLLEEMLEVMPSHPVYFGTDRPLATTIDSLLKQLELYWT